MRTIRARAPSWLDAKQMFSSRGWITRPSSYHRTPPPLANEDVRTSRGWAMGLGYERITYESGFSPRTGEPGSERWMGYEPNREAVAAIVRRPDDAGGPRPWLVCVHGFAMGYPFLDFTGLHTTKLHRRLGVNVALPVLPLHGPRKVTRVSGEPFLSFDLMNTVHGFSQAVWDIRRLLSWIRAQGATSIGLYGVSLGAYVVALLAGIEDGLDAVVAGIPMVDLPALFHEQSPAHIRARSIEHHIIGGPVEEVFVAVSPLSFAPKVPQDRRFIFAGHGDRLALPHMRIDCGSTGNAHRSAGTGGPTWATSGPARLPPSSRTPSRHPALYACHRTGESSRAASPTRRRPPGRATRRASPPPIVLPFRRVGGSFGTLGQTTLPSESGYGEG